MKIHFNISITKYCSPVSTCEKAGVTAALQQAALQRGAPLGCSRTSAVDDRKNPQNSALPFQLSA